MTWDSKSDSVPPEQRIYARWLAAGSNLTFALLVTAFIIYSAGVVPPWVPLAELPNYWGLSADRFAAATLRDGRPMEEALVNLTVKNLSNLTPHPWYSFYHYSHPTPVERIEAIRRIPV